MTFFKKKQENYYSIINPRSLFSKRKFTIYGIDTLLEDFKFDKIGI